jgi:hypothetical protein
LVLWILVNGNNNQGKSNQVAALRLQIIRRKKWGILCMRKYRTSLVQEIIHTEFEAAFDHPAKRPVVVIYDVIDEERVVAMKFWSDGCTGQWYD